MPDDAQLLRRYAEEKSEAAFAELVARYLDLVYSAALRQVGGDAHRAQDVAQVVFTALARKAGTLASHPVLAGWLYTATQHAAAKVVRAEARRHAREQAAHAMNDLLSDDTASADWARVRPVLDDAMRELSEPDREAVLLRFFAQCPFAEIGAALNLSEDAARMRVDRALDKLHALLGRRGVTSTSTALAVVLANQAVASAPAGLLAAVTSTALSGATAAAGALGFIHFMSTTKIITTATGIVALLALGTAVYEARRAAASDLALITARREHAELQANLAQAGKRAQQADDELAAARRELDDVRANAAKPGTATARNAPAVGTSPVDYVLDHPESRAAYLDGEVARARAHFERFFRQTGLSPAQQDQFLKNLRDYAEARLDFMGVMRAQGYQPGTPPQNREVGQQLGRMEKQAPIDLSANMRALLGDDGFSQYQQYARTLPARNVVDDVASRLYDSDTPLTAAQAAQLTGILVQNPFRDLSAPSPGNTMAGTFVSMQAYGSARTQVNTQGGSTLTDWREPVTDAALVRAAAVLTPAQMAALRLVQEQQMAQLLSAPAVHTPDIPTAKGKAVSGK